MGPSERPPTTRNPDLIYQPEPGERQLSVRAVVVGCLIGGIVSCMNIYFGLRTGWTEGGSLIAAILGFAVFAVFAKTPLTVLETNITQTAGSAAGTMASAAGLLAAIPAMKMLGYQIPTWGLFVWALSVAYLGVFLAVPLRRQMVVVERLRFPTGTATAHTILSMLAKAKGALRKARVLIIFGIGAGVFTLAAFFVPQIQHPPFESWIPVALLVNLAAWGFSLHLSPMLFGAGVLIGPRIGASLFAGAVVGWGILAWVANTRGWAPGKVMSLSDGARGWILWPGVAIMVGDALCSLALSWRTIVRTFKRPTAAGAPSETRDVAIDPEDVPNKWWMGGLVVASIGTTIVAWLVFDIPPFMTVIAIGLTAVLAMIAARSVGETDINPIGGMGKVSQLVFGALSPGNMSTNLMAAGIAGAGASQAGDMMTDFKSGRLLGSSPRKQFLAQLVGIGAGVCFCVPVYLLFDAAYTIGEGEVPAPAAHAWRAVAELLAKGLEALPPYALWPAFGGLLFGVAIPILRKHSPTLKPYLPSGLAFGIAFIVQAYYSVIMFLGSMAFLGWERKDKASADELGFPVASGLLAGEGLMGVVLAILTIFGFHALT